MLSSRCDSPIDPHAHPYEYPDQPMYPAVNSYDSEEFSCNIVVW